MNSMAQANTEVCSLEVSLGLGLLARVNEQAPMLVVPWAFWVMPLSDHIKPPKNKMLDLNSLPETLI
jgi:hypothetical protein